MRLSFRKDHKTRIDCPGCDRGFLFMALYDPMTKVSPYKSSTIKKCSNCHRQWLISAPHYLIKEGREGVIILMGDVESKKLETMYTVTNRTPLEDAIDSPSLSDIITLELKEFEDFELD